MDLFSVLFGVVIGAIIGAWGYRYALKRDPDAVEELAKEIKRRGQ